MVTYVITFFHLLQLFSPALEEAEVEEYLAAPHQRLVVLGPVNRHEAILSTVR